MATHSSVFAGKIPWIEEIGLLQQSDFPNSGNKSVSSARHIVRAKDVLCNEWVREEYIVRAKGVLCNKWVREEWESEQQSLTHRPVLHFAGLCFVSDLVSGCIMEMKSPNPVLSEWSPLENHILAFQKMLLSVDIYNSTQLSRLRTLTLRAIN